MLVMFCQTCCQGSTTYRKWIAHLFSPIHQKKARNKIKDWPKKVQSRAVIFTEFCKLNQEINEDVIRKLAWSVSEHTIISDLYFDCGKQLCVILIDEKKGAEYIVNMDEIEAGVCRPFKQIAKNIPDVDWENIFKKRDKGEKHFLKSEPLDADVVPQVNPIIEIDIEDSDDDNIDNGTVVGETLEDGEQVLTAENSFTEDVSLENDFVIEDRPVLEFYDDRASVVEKDCDIKKTVEVQANSGADFEEEFISFIKENTLSRDAVKMRKQVVGQLATILQRHYKKTKLYPFESGLEKLTFLRSSTIVVGVDIKGHFNNSNSPIDLPARDMLKIRELLCSAKPDGNCFCVNLYKNIFGRGLSINFTHYRSKIECECYFFHKMSLQKLKFVSACMDIDPRVFPLTNFLVSWYEKCRSNLTDGQPDPPNKFLVFYPFIQLVIYYLIEVGIVPYVSIWRQNCTENVRIKNINVGFCEDKMKVLNVFRPHQKQESIYSEKDMNLSTRKPSARCVLGLAAGFFEYFGKVDLKNNIVSLVVGLVHKYEHPYISPKDRKQKVLAAEVISNPSATRVRRNYISFKQKKSIKPTAFIIQDACDNKLYEFCPQWSQTSMLNEFQSVCCSTALEINNILSGHSPLRNLWRFFPPRDLTTDDSPLEKPCGFISTTNVIKSTCFNAPSEVMDGDNGNINSSRVGLRKFWFHVLRQLFDSVFEDIFKFQVQSTQVESGATRKKQRKYKGKKAPNPDTEDDDDGDPAPTKKRKGNDGNLIGKQASLSNSLQHLMSGVRLPNRGVYIKTYFVESRFSNADPDLRSTVQSTMYSLPADPLAFEKIISDRLERDDLKDETKMTCKVLIDTNKMIAGIHIETQCDDQHRHHVNIIKLRNIISLFRDVAIKYSLYRLQVYSKKIRKC